MTYTNRGLVKVVIAEAMGFDVPSEAEMGLFGRYTTIEDPDFGGVGEPPMIRARVVARVIEGMRFRLVLVDVVNTSVAEQTFSALNKFRSHTRAMRPSRGQFYVHEVVISRCMLKTQRLHQQGMDPLPTPEDEPRHRIPLVSVYVGMRRS